MITLFVGQKLQHFNELPSTNAYLKELLRTQGPAEGFTVRANHQTSGRGQFGNVWHDAQGQNLLFSVLLRPRFLMASKQFYLNMSVCLAIVEVLNRYCPGFLIKWPNDILYKNKKICGLLIENGLIGSYLESSIIGVGLNVNQEKFAALPQAASLSGIVGERIDLEILFANVLKQLEVEYLRLMKDVDSAKTRYMAHLFGYGREVNVLVNGQKEVLTVLGVSPEGKLRGLLLGEEQHFAFKQLRFLLD